MPDLCTVICSFSEQFYVLIEWTSYFQSCERITLLPCLLAFPKSLEGPSARRVKVATHFSVGSIVQVFPFGNPGRTEMAVSEVPAVGAMEMTHMTGTN
jgi:hypothetical protein